ncbi:hypothetical protein GQ600_21917 [Phytophthora cactorum]|nr:hypothetical protein GQ600_21917 [Phytophthora cactorum]
MQWEGMPEDGWVVDVTTRACQCRFHTCVRILSRQRSFWGYLVLDSKHNLADFNPVINNRDRQVRQEIIDEQSSHSQSSTSGGMEDDSRYRTATFRASISAELTSEAIYKSTLAWRVPILVLYHEYPMKLHIQTARLFQLQYNLRLDKLFMILQLA